MSQIKNFLDVSNIDSLSIKGKGGQEKILSNVLTKTLGWNRVSKPLYDFYNSNTNEFYELKKQVDCQWFDPSKYHNLTDQDKDIKILFFLIDKSHKIEKIFTVKTSHFIERNNWGNIFLQESSEYTNKFKSFKPQIKISVKMRDFLSKNKDVIEILYDKQVF